MNFPFPNFRVPLLVKIPYIYIYKGGDNLRKLKNYDEDDIISKIFFLYFSFMHGAVGLFLFLKDISQFQSKVFEGMSSIMPMKMWGLIFLLSALWFFITAFQEGRPKFTYMTLAGLFGAIVFGIFAMASLELATDQTTTINYVIISSIDLIVALVGGVALWNRRS